MKNDWVYYAKSNALQKRLFTDMEKGVYTDVKFLVGRNGNQREFKAHRLVLAAEISEFENLLRGSDKEIVIPDVHPKGFENLIRYCYGAGFRFPGDLLVICETLLAAEKFKVPKLKLALESHLMGLVKSESVTEILQFSIDLKMPRLKERCLGIISSLFDKALMTVDLVSAPLEVLELVLSLSPDHGLEFKMCALVTLLRWAKKHKCPEDATLRLLSLVQDEYFLYGDTVSFFKTNIEQITDNVFNEVMKGVAKKFYLHNWIPFMMSIDPFGSTVVVSPKGTITQDKASEMKQKTVPLKEVLLDQARVLEQKDEKEIVVDQAKVLEQKDEKEIVVDQAKVLGQKDEKEIVVDPAKVLGQKDEKEIVVDPAKLLRQEDEKERDADEDSVDDDDGLVMENMIEELTKEACGLIKTFVTGSSQKTEARMTKAVSAVLNHANETVQKAADDMMISFGYLHADTSKEQKAEKTADLTEASTDLTEASSFTVGSE